MRRWDRLVDLYIELYRARGICEATVGHVGSRLERWGSWLKQRRPRVALETIDAEPPGGRFGVQWRVGNGSKLIRARFLGASVDAGPAPRREK